MHRLHTALLLMAGLLGSVGLAQEAPTTKAGFAIAAPGYEFSFPRDHGAHPDFKIEWWYITGHLFAKDGRRFGYQATWFRIGNKPGASDQPEFGSDNFYMAHMALIDVAGDRFRHEERLNRDGWDAWAKVGDLDLRNGNWTLKREGVGEEMHLKASIRGDAALDLRLQPAKPRVLFGDKGISKKGADPSAASLYITFPRLLTEGTLRLGDEVLEVSGSSWMDHEISSSQLAANQIGWDWVSIQLDNGEELMVYQLRTDAGKPDPWSRLTWIGPKNQLTAAGPETFALKPIRTWTSPHTGGSYPIEVDLHCVDASGKARVLQVRPLRDDQELIGRLGGVSYWEGACDVLENGTAIGRAYMELTGYAGTLNPFLSEE